MMVKTVPVHYISFSLNGTYVDLSRADSYGMSDIYTVSAAIEFNKPDLFYAQLFGRYTDWDLNEMMNANDDDIVWEANVNKTVWAYDGVAINLFFTIHNMFNGSQYTNGDSRNPDRWVQMGLRCDF